MKRCLEYVYYSCIIRASNLFYLCSHNTMRVKEVYWFLFFFHFLFLNVTLLSQEKYEWKLVKNSNNIKAYVKKENNSKVKSVKVETVAEASLSQLVSIIKDASSHNEWVFMNNGACILDSIDRFHWKYHGWSELPWPVMDRDFITDVVLIQDSVDYSIKIISRAIPDYLPENEDFVRVPLANSQWTLNPIGNGSVHITFELLTDIGGKIPAWFINLAVTKGPMGTMEGLLEQLNKCEGIKLDYINEL